MANPVHADRYVLPDGRLAVNVTENKTLAAEDSGIVQVVVAESIVVTLPATATQGCWTVMDGGKALSGGPVGAAMGPVYPRVDPNAADSVAGLNVEGTEANGKYLSNTGNSPIREGRVGDEITILNTAATDGGIVLNAKGDWTRES